MIERSLMRVLVRREQLRARIEDQRRDLARCGARLARPLALLDKVAVPARVLRAHPALACAGIGAGLLLRGRALVRLLARAFAVWRLARRAQALLRFVGH